MPLTGDLLPITLGVVASLVLALLVTGRPRLQREWCAALMRAVWGVLFAVLVLATCAAALNNQYAFYTSWSDLLGGSESPAEQSQHGARPADSLSHPVPPSQTASSTSSHGKSDLKRDGRFAIANVDGKKSGMKHQHVRVYLPKGYDPHRKGGYPVIIAMHGFPGSAESFRGVDDYYKTIDQAVESGRMAAPIVVIPNINPRDQFASECVDSAKGPKVLTWVSQDLPAWTRENFNTAAPRTSWATWGYSFGAYCATSTAMRQPQTFGAAVAFQPYFRPEFTDAYRPFKPGSPQFEDADLVHRAGHHPAPVAVWLMTVQKDRQSYPTTREFISAAHSPLSVTAVIGQGGGHRMQVWTRRMPMSYEWLGRNIPGFAPPANAKPSKTHLPSPGVTESN